MSLSDFEIQKELGKGAFGCVYIAKRKIDGIYYAIKRVKIGSMSTKDKENALNEVRILASLSHPNVIDYKEAFIDEESGTLNIVMEFADEGDLANKIKIFRNKKSYISENEIWSYLIQMVEGLKALHDKKIMHRDLKSANIFINKKGEVKLGDLNVSKVVKMGFLYTQTGTPYYASPEVWSEKPYDYKSDLWSVGCVVYELCALKPPFRAQNIEQLFKSVTKGVYDQLPSIYSKELQHIVAQLLYVDPKKRPSCDCLLDLPLIKKKMKAGNLQLTVCQGTLLNTIKWTVNSGDVNDKLSKLNRYNFKLVEPTKNKGIINNCKSTIQISETISPNLNTSTTSNSGNDSKEFQMNSKSPLNEKNNLYKSPVPIKKYIINLLERQKDPKVEVVKKSRKILDIISGPSRSKSINRSAIYSNKQNSSSDSKNKNYLRSDKCKAPASIEIDLYPTNENVPITKKCNNYANAVPNLGIDLKVKLRSREKNTYSNLYTSISQNINLNKKIFAKSPRLLHK